MRMLKYLLPICLLATPALAQQQQRPMTPAEMQGAVQAAIAQRNIAQSMQIESEAKLAGVTDELVKMQAHVKELEAKKPESEEKK